MFLGGPIPRKGTRGLERECLRITRRSGDHEEISGGVKVIMKAKAAILTEYQKPLAVDEIDLEQPKEKEVLVKMQAAGLCHSDYSVSQGIIRMPPLPCIPGHEGAGVVQEVGPCVTRVKPGDHVLIVWVPSCGKCYYCSKKQPYLCAEKDITRAGTMLDGTYRVRCKGKNIHVMQGVGTFSEYTVVSCSDEGQLRFAIDADG